MSYQPISIQGPEIPDFAATLHQAREEQRQREQDRWNQMIQGRTADRADQELGIKQEDHANQMLKFKQDAMVQAQDLRSAGLVHQAEMIEGIHGIQATPNHPADLTTQPERPPEPARETPLQAGDLPPTTNYGPFQSPEDALATSRRDLSAQRIQPTYPEIGKDVIAHRTEQNDADLAELAKRNEQQRLMEGANITAEDQYQQRVAQHPGEMRDWQAKMEAYQAEQANPTVSYSVGGQPVAFDPREKQNAEEARNRHRAELFLHAMKGTPLEATAPEYSGLIAADESVKAGDVLGMQKAEMAAKAKAAEDKAKEAEQLRTHPDVATQSQWQRDRNAAIMAGRSAIGGEVPVDPKVYAQWESHKEHTKAATMTKAITMANAMLDRIDSELADPANPYKQAMGIHSAAALSTTIGSSGGRVTVQASRDIKEAVGWLDSWENKAYRAVHGGANMPSIVQKAQQAMANLRGVNHEAATRAYDHFHKTAGAASPWGQDPAMAAHVQAEDVATADELGVQPMLEHDGDNGEASQPARHPGHPSHHGASHPAPAGKIGGPEDPLLKKYGYQ